jgi:hypothetical protein
VPVNPEGAVQKRQDALGRCLESQRSGAKLARIRSGIAIRMKSLNIFSSLLEKTLCVLNVLRRWIEEQSFNRLQSA